MPIEFIIENSTENALQTTRNASDDNKRWQGKEYDEPIRKLYFGSRYFDPFFGMWMSPNPAAQFANPYTYGGDPLNYVDPNGEWVHIVVGAVIGAVVGTVNGAIQCTAPGGGGSCGKSIGVQASVGAAIGAATAATGGAVSGLGATVAGSAGLASGSGTVAALAAGAVEGGITGVVGGGLGYASTMGINKATTGSFGFDGSEFAYSLFMGGLTGTASGALISTSAVFNTKKAFSEYGQRPALFIASAWRFPAADLPSAGPIF